MYTNETLTMNFKTKFLLCVAVFSSQAYRLGQGEFGLGHNV